MERPTSTTKYETTSRQAEPSALREIALELPDGRDFAPARRPRFVPSDFYELCASFIPRLRSRDDYRERRTRDRCDVEFDLHHPERVPATYNSELVDELFELAARTRTKAG